MAIAFNAAADLGNNGGTTNSLTSSYTSGSGANRMLIVAIAGDFTTLGGGGGFDDITGVTYAGTSMTLAKKLVDNSSANSQRYSYIYFLLAPATGANNVVISCTNNHYLMAVAADYTGVAQSGQPDSTASNFNYANISTLTTSIGTVADNSWAILVEDGYNANAAPIAGTGDVLRITGATFGQPGLFDSNGVITPAGSYSMTTTRSSNSAGIQHVIASFSPFVTTIPPGSYDYPNPSGYRPGVVTSRTHTDSYKLELIGRDTFYGSSGKAPNFNWPNPNGHLQRNPAGAAVTAKDNVWQDRLINLLQGQDSFYGGRGYGPDFDYPNPRGYVPSIALKTHIDPYKLNLQGRDTFFAGPGAGPDYDWPNPRGYVGSITLRTWTDLATRLQGKDTFFAAPGMGPVYDQSNPVGRKPQLLPATAQPSLLATLLAALVAPFANFDWPNPFAKLLFSLVSRSHLDPVKLTLQGQDQFFGAAGQGLANLDWPNPKGYVPSIVLKTHIDPYKLSLQGQDQFFAAPGMAPVYDLSNPPRRKTQLIEAPAPSLLATLLAILLQPFANFDWPLPLKGWASSLIGRTHLDPLKLALQGQDRFYGDPGQVVPNTDWPPPRGAAPGVITGRSYIETLKLELIGQDTFFGAAGQAPANLDWPNPRGATYSIVLRTYTEPVKLDLIGQDQFYADPGRAPIYDYPNPRGYTQAIVLKTHVDPFKLTLVGLDRFYGDPGEVVPNTDWPVPKGRPHPSDLRTFIDPLKPNLQGKDTFFGSPGQPPFYDYPNPRGYVPGVVLRTWIEPFKLNLQGQDQFFAGVGMAPTYTYPNPISRRPLAVAGDPSPPSLLTMLLGIVALPFAYFDWPNPFSRLLFGRALFDQIKNINLTPPSPPVTDTPQSGFIANLGRMMIRRG